MTKPAWLRKKMHDEEKKRKNPNYHNKKNIPLTKAQIKEREEKLREIEEAKRKAEEQAAEKAKKEKEKRLRRFR